MATRWARFLIPTLLAVGFAAPAGAATTARAARRAVTPMSAHAAAQATQPAEPRVAPALAPPDSFFAQYAATRGFRLGRPNAITVTPHGDAILFLRSGPRSFVQDLYSYDVASAQERVFLTAESILRGGEEKLSVEERARRERTRQTARGIASFQLSEDGARVLVPLSGRLFVAERATGALHELTSHAGFPLDPRFSHDATRVACVRDKNLYVTDVATNRETRLTSDGAGTISNAEAEFVAQEEMARREGFWWSPDDKWIAYQQTDVAHVETFHIADPAHPESEPQAWAYPRPGKRNAEVKLGIISALGGRTTWVTWDRERYPYMASVVWTKHAPLTVLVQNREQTEEVLLAVDAATGATKPLLTERDAAWINLFPGMPKWFDDGSSFLWMTERNGANELERRARDGTLMGTLTGPDPHLRTGVNLDEPHHVVWLRTAADPTQAALCRAAIDPTARSLEPVWNEPGLHDDTFGLDHSIYVHTVSPARGPTRWTVRRADGAAVGELRAVAERPGFEPKVELTTVRVDTATIHALIIRPRDFKTGKRYPVIDRVYGGPTAQEVQSPAGEHVLDQWLADRGFIVVAIDGRGTPNRGRAWERVLKNDLIQIPLADQCAALQALGKRYSEMDLARVGITGWSFGGYFTVLALERRPDVFHSGVAGAPVTDWLDYDTHYTERYMGLPDQNAAGYTASSALTYAKDLARPLLIIHGTADDNVYFVHTLRLCDALVRAGRSFEFVPLMGYTHIVADQAGVTQVNLRILAHFKRTLGEPR